MIWDLRILRNDVGKLYGTSQLELLRPCIESVVQREQYAHYHFKEAERLLNEGLEGKTNKFEILPLVFSGMKETIFDKYQTKATAHILGCLQNMHSVTDILSHLIYYSLNMNNDPNSKIIERHISIKSVKKKLDSKKEFIELSGQLEKLIIHPNYEYLSDIVNHSKHRCIVGTSFTLHMNDDAERAHGLEFVSFDYEERKYESRWVDTYIKQEYDRQTQKIVEIGSELNRIIHKRLLNVCNTDA